MQRDDDSPSLLLSCRQPCREPKLGAVETYETLARRLKPRALERGRWRACALDGGNAAGEQAQRKAKPTRARNAGTNSKSNQGLRLSHAEFRQEGCGKGMTLAGYSRHARTLSPKVGFAASPR